MPSLDSNAEAGSSNSTPLPPQEAALPPIQAQHRAIYSYWGGNNSASSSYSQAGQPAVSRAQGAKRKRKKEVGVQARLSIAKATNTELGGEEEGSQTSSGVGWGIDRPEAVIEKKAAAGIRKKKIGDGEEAEMRDMVPVTNVTSAKGRKKRKSAAAIVSADETNPHDPIDPAILDMQVVSLPGLTSKTAKADRIRKSGINSSSFDMPSADHLPAGIPSTTRSLHSRPVPSSSSLPEVVVSSSPPAEARPRRSSDFDIEITQCNLVPNRIGNSFVMTHPLFARTTSKGLAVEDAIDVEEVPEPSASSSKASKKIVFASDSRATHSFFRPAVNNTLEGTGGTRSRASSITSEAPTISSMVTGGEREKKLKSPAKKKVHAFFKMGGQTAGKMIDGWGGGHKEGEEWQAPWPNGDWVKQDLYTNGTPATKSSGIPRRCKRKAAPAADTTFWQQVLLSTASSTDQGISKLAIHDISATPSYISRHPAFSSISTKAKIKTSNRDTWAERYRPLRADQVLGNELEAMYLRDWLSALAVGHHDGGDVNGSKLPKVVRKVRRQKKSALVDGWIVDDLGLYGTTLEGDVTGGEEDDDVDLEELDEPEISHDECRPDSYPALRERLTNTILLTGPHGSGKSATVYAAATELGWDVFEVYPGIGKRTGGNLMALVGDVGRNHILAQGQGHSSAIKKEEKNDDEEKQNGLKSFFATMAPKGKKKNAELGSQGSAAEPIVIDAEGNHDSCEVAEKSMDVDLPSDNEHQLNTHLKGDDVRQSLILVDEADILFEEESTFWPAVIALIADSRRPVVITCNDHLRIPREQLPLQTILQFRSAASHVAIPYLRSIAEAEISISAATSAAMSNPEVIIEDIYRLATHHPEGLSDQPLPPNGHEPLPYFDLRRAISQLQLRLSKSSPTTINETPSPRLQDIATIETSTMDEELKNICRRMEVISYTDAFVDLRPSVKMELMETDRYSPTPDDELGVHTLVKPEMNDNYPTLAIIDQSAIIAQYLVESNGGYLSNLGNLHVDRTRYIRSTLPILDPLIPISAPLLPHSSLFLYTVPIILSIIESDDILQLAESVAAARGEARIDRKTGRPMRNYKGYQRWFDLDDEALGIARKLRKELSSF